MHMLSSGQLASLKKLIVASNQISVIPTSVYESQTLTYLDISGNCISSVEEAHLCTSLQALLLHGNSIGRTGPDGMG